MGLLKNVAVCGCGFEAVLEEAVTAYKGLLTSGMEKKMCLSGAGILIWEIFLHSVVQGLVFEGFILLHHT